MRVSLPLAFFGFMSIILLGQSNPKAELPLSELQVAAERGDAVSQYQLAVRYFIENNFAEAAKWLLISADQGNSAAMNELAMLYSKGQGLPKDQRESARWYRKSADQGNVLAQSILGMMYRDGTGVVRNYAEAVRWYREAAVQGSNPAQLSLGEMYYKGQGVTKDFEQAASWYRMAADQGYAPAQAVLGTMYLTGLGVVQDYVQAYMWLNLAASHSNGDDQTAYAKARDFVGSEMTSTQVAEAQQLAREWKPK